MDLAVERWLVLHVDPANRGSANSSEACLISVVMPTLNAARHLPISLGSLVAQSSRAFEIVLVDGGSDDGTVDLACQLFESACIAYRIEMLPGSGIYAAMNHGVSVARGDWIYLLGADDRLWDETVFGQMAPWLNNADPDVLVVHGDVWIEDPGYRYGQPWDLRRFLTRNISHQSAFYRRSRIQELGVTYNLRYELYADWDYNLKLFTIGRFQHVPILVASYACTGKSSQRVDEVFLAELEANAVAYCGWRALWMVPPHSYSVAIAGRGSHRQQLELMLNRLVWLAKRFVGMNA